MADKGAPDGICVAFGQNAYALSPTWTRLDDPNVPVWGHKTGSPHNTNCVSGWTVDRGRTYELDKTQTGTATITLQDPNGLFDPTNASSPFYGQIFPMMRCSISMFNPSTTGYTVVFTGFIESFTWTMTVEEKLMIVTMHLVDGFEPLTRAELIPDETIGGLCPTTVGATTLCGDANGTACQTRINGLLDAAGWPTDGLSGNVSRWRNVNTGNVFLQTTIYNPQTGILSAIQDTADAEFPGVANVFINKAGALTFYGRYPRFQPTNFPNDVTIWQVADRGGVAPSGGAALITNIEWNYDQTNIINACLSYPAGIVQADVAAQLFTNPDLTSKNRYGYRSTTLQDLLCFGQPAGSGAQAQHPQPATQAGANATAFYYAQYYVLNYSAAQLRISLLQFTSQAVGSSQTWQFLTGVEIGDLLTVFTSNPGGGGFSKETAGQGIVTQFFVEGLHYQVAPLTSNILDVTLTVDVSPRQWFTTMPWAA